MASDKEKGDIIYFICVVYVSSNNFQTQDIDRTVENYYIKAEEITENKK